MLEDRPELHEVLRQRRVQLRRSLQGTQGVRGGAQRARHNAEAAARVLKEKTYRKETDAYKAYIIGKLPPAQVDGRARRWAVKLFLSHVHCVWYFAEYGKLPPKPYVIEHLGHVRFVKPQHTDLVPGLTRALSRMI